MQGYIICLNKNGFCLAAVVLVGGTTTGNGNVFARNPTTGIYGPVCDDLWDINDVTIYFDFNVSKFHCLNNTNALKI